MRLGSSARSKIKCSVQNLEDSTVVSHPGCKCSRLAFPASGLLLVTGSDGNWIVSPSRAVWLVPEGRHEIRAIGNVRLKSFGFEPDSTGDLPKESFEMHVNDLFRHVMRSLVRYANNSEFSQKTVLLIELMLEKIINQVPAPVKLPLPKDPRLVEICTNIQLNPDDMTSLRDYASRLDCTERTLHRLFLRETGISFTTWRHQAKLRVALEWLAQGRPIVDIAMDLGYQNQGAFSTMFRKYFGMAPSQYVAPDVPVSLQAAG